MTALIGVITLFACEGNYQNIKKFSLSDGSPIAVGKDIDFKYTDSGKLITNLLAPELLDFSNLKFPYKEFPQGIEVHFWDKDREESIIESDYAVQYDDNGLVDLRENVKIITADSMVLQAEQLYWDQKNQWVFTDCDYTIRFKDGSSNKGAGFDSNQDFTIFFSRKNLGIQIIEE